MKVAVDKSPALISNAGGQVVDIQIGASREAQVMIMRVLTDTLYTNKPEAVWREYGCNAADANIEAGKRDIPIEITLPTRLSPEAIIRDFGYGMTESRMLDVYCKLGESTKRGSNDETGMIGIGAKAGFAYHDMFTVISFNGGLKTIYQFFKDGGVPRMMLFSREESSAPEGTEIKCTKARQNFWKKNQMDGVPMIMLSSLPPLLTANGTSTASAHRSKHAARAFVLDEQCTQTRYSCKTRSIWWTVEDVDKDTGKGVYVVVRGFKAEPAKGDEFIEPCELMSDMARLRQHGLVSGKLYAFKRGKDDKLPKLGVGWVPLRQHVAGKVKTWAAKYAQEIADYEETVRIDALLPDRLVTHLPDCIAKECIEVRKRMSHKAGITLADAIRQETFGEWCPRSLLVLPKPSVDLTALQNQVRECYRCYNSGSFASRKKKA